MERAGIQACMGLHQPGRERRRHLDEPHVLPLDLVEAHGLLAELEDVALGRQTQGLGVLERVFQAERPEPTPPGVDGDREGGGAAKQRLEHPGLVDDVRVGDEHVVSAVEEVRGAHQRRHHVGAIEGRVVARGKPEGLEAIGAVARHQGDVLDACAAQGRELVEEQRCAGELDHALGTIEGVGAQTPALPRRQDDGPQPGAPKKRARSAASRGSVGPRSGCHMIAAWGSSGWRSASTEPSGARAAMRRTEPTSSARTPQS